MLMRLALEIPLKFTSSMIQVKPVRPCARAHTDAHKKKELHFELNIVINKIFIKITKDSSVKSLHHGNRLYVMFDMEHCYHYHLLNI